MSNEFKFWIPLAGGLIGLSLLVFLLWPSAPDFSKFATGDERKQAFIRHFVPLVNATNAEILKDRETAIELSNMNCRITDIGRNSVG